MSEHTAGPWKVDPSAAEQRGMGGERIYKVVTDRRNGTPNGLIADVSAWWVDTESAKANARLIAAAPELLEACEALEASPYLFEGDDLGLLNQVRDAIDSAKPR